MRAVHEFLGIAVLLANGLAAAWGGLAWYRRIASVAFWPILRTAQALVVIEVTAGLIILAGHHKPPDALHYVYGIAPLLVALVTEGMRAGAAQAELQAVVEPDALERREQVALARRVVIREMGIMTIGALLIVTLSLRAAQSGGLF
ncbi:MAG: hypothetical protein NVSMB25_11850 [Thermoleophilaceae bacterium]